MIKTQTGGKLTAGRWCFWRRQNQSGQAMLEYLVVSAILLSALAILTFFLETFKEYGWRILDMVASDYP